MFMPHTMSNEESRILYIQFLFPFHNAQVDLQWMPLAVEIMGNISSLNIYTFFPFQHWVSTCNYMEEKGFKNI